MFLGIFEAIKPHQAKTAMCDQHSCPTAFLHAAAEHQQLKASWGVVAETEATRKKRGKESQNKPKERTKYLKSSDESWTWRLPLLAAPNDTWDNCVEKLSFNSQKSCPHQWTADGMCTKPNSLPSYSRSQRLERGKRSDTGHPLCHTTLAHCWLGPRLIQT